MLRVKLSSTVLSLLAMGIDIETFELLDKPSEDQLKAAFEQLEKLKAVSGQSLTDEGCQMAALPVEPSLAKVLVTSKEEEFLAVRRDVVDIVALMQVETVFYTPPGKREEVRQSREKFLCGYSDHLTLLNVYREWQQNREFEWSKSNFINHKSLLKAEQVAEQLKKYLKFNESYDEKLASLDMSRSEREELIIKCFYSGYFQRTARHSTGGMFMSTVFS